MDTAGVSNSSLELPTEGTIVAHVVVVGFHAQLGNRIEFAYPRLRGDPILRSPKISDTSDISFDVSTPRVVRQDEQNAPADSETYSSPTRSPSHRPLQDWGVLPDEWSFLPFMALPDGVHDQTHDLVFFTLPPDVHCVACFRQVTADSVKTHSAASGRSYERSVASRGSVQKSVVLLCRRPYFGVLADRLTPAVRAYFDQADFANTQVLASLFHSLNVSLARPSLSNADTFFHGLDLQTLVRRLGPQLLAVLKLILLERRLVIYSQPVRHASNAVIALASIFNGALDTISPKLRPLDTSPDDAVTGLPLSIFGPADRVVLQPYAPLPMVSQLIPNDRRNGCLIGTSHNVGILLSSTAAAHARRVNADKRNSFLAHASESPLNATKTAIHSAISNATSDRNKTLLPTDRGPSTSSSIGSSELRIKSEPSSNSKAVSGGVPIVDALVNLATGKVSVSAALEPYCRVTKAERIFMRDLLVSTAQTSASVSLSGSTGPFVGSDDYIRVRLRSYLSRFLHSVASIDGVHGGPVGGETWNTEMAQHFDLTEVDVYNESFVRQWLTTRNAAEWARRCGLRHSKVIPPPAPEVETSPSDDGALNVDVVAAGLSGLRKNVAEFGRLTTAVSSKAAEGLSSLFRRIELEVARMDSAVNAATNHVGTSGGQAGLPTAAGGRSEPGLKQVGAKIKMESTKADGQGTEGQPG